MNITWDAQGYTDGFSFVHRFGEDVLSLLDAPEGSFVVDLGCGNGALTQKLAQRGYRVLGVDASPEMLVKARALRHRAVENRDLIAVAFGENFKHLGRKGNFGNHYDNPSAFC